MASVIVKVFFIENKPQLNIFHSSSLYKQIAKSILKILQIIFLYFPHACYAIEGPLLNSNIATNMNKWLVKSTFYCEQVVPTMGRFDALYFSIQENIFLNVRFGDSVVFEKVGDFFLSGFQYLFDGKKAVQLNNGQLELKYIFTDSERSLLKTAVAIVTLAPALLLGSSLKSLACFSSEVRNRYQQIKEMRDSVLVKPVDYSQHGITSLFSKQLAPCQDIDYGKISYNYLIKRHPNLVDDPRIVDLQQGRLFPLTKRQSIEVEALRDIMTIFIQNRIACWIDYGTCLGAYRNHKIIPWDLDTDLGIPQVEFENACHALKNLNKNKYQVRDASPKDFSRSYIVVYIRETGTLIDIDTYSLDPEKRTVTYIYPHENSSAPEWWKERDKKHIIPYSYDDIFPLRPTKLEGIDVFVPNHIQEYLQDTYAPSTGGRLGDISNIDPIYYWDPIENKWIKIESNPYWIDYPDELGVAEM